jgi:SRSO17 transposase
VFFLNYETKFLISLIFKKISKDNLKKNINFDKKKKKETKNVRQKKRKIRKKNIRGKLTFIKHITFI